jgi:hypothetical protein
MSLDESNVGLDDSRSARLRNWEWVSERCGWIAMIGVVGAACTGMLGNGPASARSTTTTDGTLQVSYDAICRRDAPEEIVLAIHEASSRDAVDVGLSQAFMSQIVEVEWLPPPATVSITDSEIIYGFRTEFTECSPTLRFRHRSWGRKVCAVRVADRSVIEFSQLVLP